MGTALILIRSGVGYGKHRALVEAVAAGLAMAQFVSHGMLSVAGGFEGDELFFACGDTATAAGAFIRVDCWGRFSGHEWAGLQGEFQLLPGAALDPGAGIIARTDSDQHGCRLFACAAAGETQGVGFGLLFHNPTRWRISRRAIGQPCGMRQI